MKYRALRIAWSAAWGVVAVLLVVLWVRSYWHSDRVGRYFGNQYFGLITQRGELGYTSAAAQNRDPTPWRFLSVPVSADTPGGVLPVALDTVPLNRAFGLKWLKFANSLQVAIPFHMIVLVSIAIGAISWLPWSTRFTLRTLLIATTLVAVGLGVVVWLR